MADTDNSVEALVAQALKALDAWDKVPPGERFDWMVKIGLIDEQGRLRHDGVEEVPIKGLFKGRDGPNGNGRVAGG